MIFTAENKRAAAKANKNQTSTEHENEHDSLSSGDDEDEPFTLDMTPKPKLQVAVAPPVRSVTRERSEVVRGGERGRDNARNSRDDDRYYELPMKNDRCVCMAHVLVVCIILVIKPANEIILCIVVIFGLCAHIALTG